MIYAMHAIQVGCVVHHAQESGYFRQYLRQLVEEQRLDGFGHHRSGHRR